MAPVSAHSHPGPRGRPRPLRYALYRPPVLDDFVKTPDSQAELNNIINFEVRHRELCLFLVVHSHLKVRVTAAWAWRPGPVKTVRGTSGLGEI